jgi:excisionase family DNA binding protein
MGLTEQPAPLLLTAVQAARLLSISPRSLWSLTAKKEIRCLHVGRLVRYRLSDLQRWIDGKCRET